VKIKLRGGPFDGEYMETEDLKHRDYINIRQWPSTKLYKYKFERFLYDVDRKPIRATAVYDDSEEQLKIKKRK